METKLALPSGHRRWWLMEGIQAAQTVHSILEDLHKNQSQRKNQYQTSARLYGNQQIKGAGGFAGGSLQNLKTSASGHEDRITYNLSQSLVDTVTAKISKNKPKPYFLTSGGDYKQQRKAKKLNQFIEGIFYENEAYSLGSQVFRDGCVLGDGVAHVYNYFGRVKFERVLVPELYVDEAEAVFGGPRSMYRVKDVDRLVLMEMFPEQAKEISKVIEASPIKTTNYKTTSDLVTVAAGWHLSSGPDADDGARIICINGHTLVKEEYKKPDFPFAFFSWSKRQYGFFSQGLVEQTQGIQLEINKLLRVIQKSMHLMGSFKILVETGSKIVKEFFNNDFGSIINYSGTPPQYITPPAVPPEIYQHLQTLVSKGYEMVGISELSAVAKKPDGLDSGKALREYDDIQSDRFSIVGQAYEKYHLDVAKLAIDVARDIDKSEDGFKVNVPGRKFLQSVKFKEVNLPETDYIIQCFPVSSLPNEPAGRLQTVQEYIQAGFLSKAQGQALLDFPDLAQVESLQNSSEEYLNQKLEAIVDDGIYSPPESYDDLARARELALQYYNEGRCSALEEDKLDLLRRFIDQIEALTSPPPPPALPPGAAPPGGPPGMPPPGPAAAVPQPPPVSDLLPNSPPGAA